ncbi:MAG: tRNA preQ1(34) S-adenosylmethionine ribosyltransferase-isomerase QueA [Deltaproteobacteria bacterium]|nr:tRNA preQ1(34) S-adenosylmethionine ribosyltransferase-isomerase QueA [Deltaproteobacteria bacterium]
MEENIQLYDYELPPSLIAQHPSSERGKDRLMVVQRQSGTIRHHRFNELPQLLRSGDLLVVNDTRVIPARIMGTKPTGGKVEFLLIQRLDEEGKVWRCMAKRVARLRPGVPLAFRGGVEGEIVSVGEGGEVDVKFSVSLSDERLQEMGEVPLPPYIERPSGPEPEDVQRYQTIFAERSGAVAAPTAGLHFSPELLEELKENGIEITRITLHVGPGTFLPVRVSRLSEHKMHAEYYEISKESTERINAAKREGRRVIAVGTTVVRTLESAAGENEVKAGGRWTSLFIYPPYQFRVVDAMVTNFHLPKSTLLVLVCSFASRELILRAYETAKREGYRFYSYGDAMLIL